jgi:hypothetical protein
LRDGLQGLSRHEADVGESPLLAQSGHRPLHDKGADVLDSPGGGSGVSERHVCF